MPDLFPPVGLYTDNTPVLGMRPIESRSHLISKAPTGEPLDQVTERQQLLARVKALEVRVDRLEQYLIDHSWRGRLDRFYRWAQDVWARLRTR